MYAPGALIYLLTNPPGIYVCSQGLHIRAISYNAVLLLEASVSHARARMGARRELLRKWTLLKVNFSPRVWALGGCFFENGHFSDPTLRIRVWPYLGPFWCILWSTSRTPIIKNTHAQALTYYYACTECSNNGATNGPQKGPFWHILNYPILHKRLSNWSFGMV